MEENKGRNKKKHKHKMARKYPVQPMQPIPGRWVCVVCRVLRCWWLFGGFRRDPLCPKRGGCVKWMWFFIVSLLVCVSLFGALTLDFHALFGHKHRYSKNGVQFGPGWLDQDVKYGIATPVLSTIGYRVPEASSETEPQLCYQPELDPFDPEIASFQESLTPLICSDEENMIYVQNGTVRIAESAKEQGPIQCTIAQFESKGDRDNSELPEIRNVPDGFPLTLDYFTASCRRGEHEVYDNVHLGVANKLSLQMRGQSKPLPPKAMGGYDVLILGFDSVSRMSWYRNMPKTRRFFINELGGIELEGHTVLGDGTVAALMPLLCGHVELDLPSTRRDNASAVPVDFYPFIWKKLKDAGYVTAWGEDMSHIGTFQMRLHGFKDSPVDHYMRSYFVTAERSYNSNHNHGCLGSELRHVRFFNYFRDMYLMYGKKRKFMFGFHSEFSHQTNNGLQWVDKDLADFLKNLNDSGYLNHTILILMSDHGARFSDSRGTQQGKLEERLPYFGLHFPPGFKAKYPRETKVLRENTKRLTTMYDIHETFHDLLDNDPLRPTTTRGRGISLFKPIPKSRTCSQAGIEPHWCACLNWVNASGDEELKLSAGNAAVEHLNSLLKVAGHSCLKLSLDRVLSLAKYVPHEKVLAFSKSADHHGDIPDFGDSMKLMFEYLQVTLVTSPGGGKFEVTIKRSVQDGWFQVRTEGISRINKYGDDSACVTKRFPSLRAFCYCEVVSNHTNTS